MTRQKILISAYACRPGRGSEPGVGWNMAREMAQYHDVWVITRARNRPAIEAELARNAVPGLHVAYCDLPRWARWWKRGELGDQLYYYLWQVAAYLEARRYHRRLHFDLVHHVTFVKYWSPSFLALLPAPFLWGPVGGGESVPRAFWRDFGWRGRLYEYRRDLARWLGELDPFVRLTARRSTRAFGTTPETAARLRALGAGGVEVLGVSALNRDEIRRLAQVPAPDGPTPRFLSVGRLLHWKGFHLSLRAFAAARIEGAEYWIVGDGPDRRRLESLVRSLGIADRVRFWGALPREETLGKLAQCHVVVHPTMHESGGYVCLEAMAAARPVICLMLGGQAVQIADDTGFRVPAHDPDQAVSGIGEAMARLVRDPGLRRAMGEAGPARVREHFSWEALGPAFRGYYEAILDPSRRAPQTALPSPRSLNTHIPHPSDEVAEVP